MPGQREGRPGDVGPRRRLAAARHVVAAVRGPARDEVHDRGGQVGGERRASDLVGDHGGLDALLGQPEHGAHEVAALADHPGGPHEVVPLDGLHREVARCLGRAVGRQWCDRRVLPVRLRVAAVEHVLRREVHERRTVFPTDCGECGRARGVGPPRGGAPLGGLGAVHVREGCGVDDGVVGGPVDRRACGVGDVEVGVSERGHAGQRRDERPSHLAAGPEHQHPHSVTPPWGRRPPAADVRGPCPSGSPRPRRSASRWPVPGRTPGSACTGRPVTSAR